MALAALLVIGASVGATVLATGRTAAPPPAPVTVLTTDTATITQTSATVVTSTSTVTATAHTCANGSIGADACRPYTCWNGSTATDGPCPELTGEKALEWLYPADGSPARTCKPADSNDLNGAVEGLECSWPDLPDIKTYLVRWPTAAAAQDFGKQFGTSHPLRGDTDGADLGIGWDMTSDTRLTRWIYDIVPGQPYSLEMVYRPTSLAKFDPQNDKQITAWFDRQTLSFPSDITEAEAAAGH